MRTFNFIAGLFVSLAPMAAFAESTQWQQFVIPSTGVEVDIPVNIFTEDAGTPEGGTGRTIEDWADGRKPAVGHRVKNRRSPAFPHGRC